MHSLVAGFSRYENDPDSKVEIREGSHVYTSQTWRKNPRYVISDTPYRDMVAAMQEYFEAHPEELPIRCEDNRAWRRVRFTNHDQSKSWEIGIHDLKLYTKQLPKEDKGYIRTAGGREKLAAMWTEDWS